jgi:hypothetical protein
MMNVRPVHGGHYGGGDHYGGHHGGYPGGHYGGYPYGHHGGYHGGHGYGGAPFVGGLLGGLTLGALASPGVGGYPYPYPYPVPYPTTYPVAPYSPYGTYPY